MTNTPKIEIPADLHWEGISNDTNLYTTIYLWDIMFHVDAIEVNKRGKALGARGPRKLALLKQLNGADDPFETVELKPGRHYVIGLHPGNCSSWDSQNAF
jgi:hypothetical protein